MQARREVTALQQTGGQAGFLENNCTEAGCMVDPHWHEACEVLFIRRGWGEQRINVERMEFHPGDVILVGPGDVHATDALSPRGCDIDVLHFTDALLPGGGMARLSSGIVHPKDGGMQSLFDAMRKYIPDGRPGQELLAGGLVQILIGLLARESEAAEQRKRSPVIEAVCAYVESAQDLHLERTAAHFGYSPEHLSRRFRAETGISYRDYCDQLRMRRAAGLLHEERSISAVAERLGYSDDSSFIRAFRQMYGITPGAYRRLCRR